MKPPASGNRVAARGEPARGRAAAFAAVAALASAGCAGTPQPARTPRIISFQTLASFEAPYVESVVDSAAGAAAIAIPDTIRALDGTRVALDGYVEGAMFPLGDGAARFAVLLTSQPFECCMHEPPRSSEVVLVEMPAGAQVVGAPHRMMRASGTLRVEPRIDSANVLHGLYRLEATSVTPAEAPHP